MRRCDRRRFLAALSLGTTAGCLRLTGEQTGADTTQSAAGGATTTDTRRTATATTADSSPTATTTPDGPQLSGFSEAWRYNGVGSPLATSNGVVYAAGFEWVYAFDPDGTIRWKTELGGGLHKGVAADDRHVYVPAKQGTLYALDRTTGEVRWQAEVSAVNRSAAVVAGDTVVVNTRDPGSLYGVHTETGERRWKLDATSIYGGGPDGLGDAAPDGTRVYLREERSYLAVDPETGAVDWRTQFDGWTAPPVVAEGAVYACSSEWVYRLDATTGEQVWRAETFGSNQTRPAVADGTVYVGSTDNAMYAFATDDGSREWRYQTGGSVDGAPLVDRGVVYTYSDDESLYALDATSGEKVVSKPVGARGVGPLVLLDGTLYTVFGADIVAFDLQF